MGMIAENSPFLPEPWAEAYNAYEINEAWYLGDTDKLQQLYQANAKTRPSHRHKGQSYSGGVVGAFTRFFWGRPTPTGQDRTRLHVPAPADLATLSSDLIWAEPPEVQLAGEDNAQKRLDLIANSPAAHATYNQMGELKAALSAAVLTVQWDKDLADNVWLATSGCDVAIPEFQNGILTAVTLWTEYREGQTVYRHLERHSSGFIEHRLFRGTETNIGKHVPLQDRPETEYLANLVDQESRIATGIKRLTAVWNPNMPTRAWRKKGQLAWVGRSDFSNIHSLFDALDEAFSSWMRDLKLGQGRIFIAQDLLKNLGIGQGAFFDMSQEAFAPINMPGNSTQPKASDFIDAQQFEIRVEEHERTVYAIYREILRAAGYSQSAWGDYASGREQTATEVIAKDKASERTRDKKILYDKVALANISAAALELDAHQYGTKVSIKELPTVTFPEISQFDPEKLARTIQLLDGARAASTLTKVKLWNPDWDEKQIQEEVDSILQQDSFVDPSVGSETVWPPVGD